MKNNIELTKLNIDSVSNSASDAPLSENEKSLDALVQQHISTRIKAAQAKGLPYTVTDKETGTVSIIQDGKVIKQRKLRSVI